MKSAINQSPGDHSLAASVRFERLLPGPIERVWQYITDPALRGQWLARGTGDPHAGGTIKLEFHNTQLSGKEEAVPEKYREHAADGVGFTATVLRCEPPRLLSHTWGGPDGPLSEVIFELTPAGDDVRLVLTHTKAADPDELLSVSAGWHIHLAVLLAKLEGAEQPRFWDTLMRLEDEYSARLAGGVKRP